MEGGWEGVIWGEESSLGMWEAPPSPDPLTPWLPDSCWKPCLQDLHKLSLEGYRKAKLLYGSRSPCLGWVGSEADHQHRQVVTRVLRGGGGYAEGGGRGPC